MPRERIQHGGLYVTMPPSDPESLAVTRKYEPGEELPKNAKVYEEQSLEVSWNRDGAWVQVAITAPKDFWEKWAESWNTDREHPDVHGDIFRTMYTGVLSRSEINAMIKTLRRARDAAYGADE